MQVYEELQVEGVHVDYERVPITDEKSPKEMDFDILVSFCCCKLLMNQFCCFLLSVCIHESCKIVLLRLTCMTRWKEKISRKRSWCFPCFIRYFLSTGCQSHSYRRIEKLLSDVVFSFYFLFGLEDYSSQVLKFCDNYLISRKKLCVGWKTIIFSFDCLTVD